VVSAGLDEPMSEDGVEAHDARSGLAPVDDDVGADVYDADIRLSQLGNLNWSGTAIKNKPRNTIRLFWSVFSHERSGFQPFETSKKCVVSSEWSGQ